MGLLVVAAGMECLEHASQVRVWIGLDRMAIFFFISLPFRRRANCFGTVATSSAAISEEQEDTKEATPPSPANQPTLTLADP